MDVFNLLNLPIVAFNCVVENMVLAVGLYKAVRLRLICKAFDEEILHAIFATDIFDLTNYFRTLFLNPKCVQMRLKANILKVHQGDLISCTIKQATTLLLDDIDEHDSEQRYLVYIHELCGAVAHNISPGTLLSKNAAYLLGDAPFSSDQDLFSAAAAVGDQATVARLLSENLNPHIKSKFFGYPSVNAARRGQKDMLALIVTPDGTGQIATELRQSVIAAFLEACRAGQQIIFEYLLDLCSRVEWLKADWLEEHSGNAFDIAASHGNTNIMKQILYDVPTIGARNDLLAQSLRKASAKGHIDTVRFLLSIGADLNRWHYWGGPLHSASRSGHANLVRLLLEKGANFYSVSRGDPLCWASMNGYKDVVQTLLDHGANINTEGPDGSVLTRAATNGETTMVRFLLQKGVDIKEYSNGDLALKEAARWGHVEIVKLLAHLGVDVNGSCDSDPPILRAMIHGQQHVVKILVELGAEEVDPLKSEYSQKFENRTYPLSNLMY